MPHSLHLSHRDDGVVVLWLDTPGRASNVLDARTGAELGDVLARLESDRDIAGVVLASAKSDHFCTGFDLEVVRRIDSPDTGEAFARELQQATQYAADFARPLACAIHGACFGAGLELALACRTRVASDCSATRLGLPDVRLGLVPAAGGTQRLPRVIAVDDALRLITTGATAGAHGSHRLGLVDEVAPPAHVIDAAAARVLALARGELRDDRRKLAARVELRLLERSATARRLVFSRAMASARARSRGRYPAPLRALEVIERGIDAGEREGLAAEARAFGELVVSRQSRALVSLYCGKRELERTRFVAPDVHGTPVSRVGVIGGGRVGTGIAYLSAARAGAAVRLVERDDDSVAAALARVRAAADHAVARRRLSDFERAQAMARVSGTTSYQGFFSCPLIAVAVGEDLERVRAGVAEAERRGPPDAVVAVATAALPIARVARDARRPERVLGLHYVAPIERARLVQIAVGARTTPEALATCLDLVRRQGKTPVVVNDGPGFYVSRILAAYLADALRWLESGVPILTLDGALEHFGFARGPLAHIDRLGLEPVADLCAQLADELGPRFAAPLFSRLRDAGCRGFYRPGAGAVRAPDERAREVVAAAGRRADLDRDSIAWRCVLRLVDEAARCYADGIIASSRDGDVAAVFGAGFPAFFGGPFHFIRDLGAGTVVARLRGFDIEPAPLLLEMAQRELGPEEAVASRH